MKIEHEQYKIHCTCGSLLENPDTNQIEGIVETHNGYVRVFHDKTIGYTSLSFIYEGVQYFETRFGKLYTQKGLSILAGKLSRSV